MIAAWLLVGAAAAGPRGVVHGADAPQGLERAFAERRVALIVGVDTYVDPALGSLDFAAKDARDLAAVLQDRMLGGYDVVYVLSGNVTADAFWDSFRAVTAGLQRDDTLLVYFAGHGTLDLGPQGTRLYALPSDAWLADAATTGIPVADIAEAVRALPARRQVLILDTCYSGTGRSVVAPEVRKRLDGLRGPVPAPAALSVSQFSANLFSAEVNQPAIEDPALGNGVYTHYFVEGLRGAADRDEDGLVEVIEAHDYARDRTLEYTGGAQVPWAETVAVGREAVFLTGDASRRRAAQQAILVGLESLPAGAQVTIDGIPRGAGPVQTGDRTLEITDGDAVLVSARLSVTESDRIEVARLARERGAGTIWTVGVLGSADPDVLSSVRVRAGAWYEPADPGGARLALGVRGDLGWRAFGFERSPVGTVSATAGWFAGDDLAYGPTLDVGAAWRLRPERTEGAPLVGPGVHASLRMGAPRLIFDASLPLVVADGQLRALPTLSMSVAYRR